MTEIIRHTPAETAKYIRADLKAAFPGVKFKVRSERLNYGEGAVRISWTLGPSRDEVHGVVGIYATEDGFDGCDVYYPAQPIEIETPEGLRLAQFVKYVQLCRHQEASTTS